jgi:hypothetical protein
MPFDDHTGTECRTEPETYHRHRTYQVVETLTLYRGSGCRSVPNDDVVPQTELPRQASRKTDLIVHSVPYPEANATYTSRFVVNTQK